ncbi:MAG: 4-(cytidine 5'-diphospho)-2-C-methyl-D-erythritol kinase [Candidatus Atribacteria bacterium]|nr:4-(cytidine 5'-diphospho)-2-C-methyl-D-erythritol kinase [Candidatus Atribacteria bacterium]
MIPLTTSFQTYFFRSYAKINWFLDIQRLRDDGYHDIRSIMQTISLHDSLALRVSEDRDRVECNYDIPTGEGSLVGQLFAAIRDVHPGCQRYRFYLKMKKRIPPASGLGGGSSNVAAILRALNDILHLDLSSEQLVEISARLGSDIPFFTTGNVFAEVSGRGERVHALPFPPQRTLVLVFPPSGINTRWAYREWDHLSLNRLISGETALDHFLHQPGRGNVEEIIWNDFESVVFTHFPELERYKKSLLEAGCQKAFMSGSGSTMAGIVLNEESARQITRILRDRGIHATWAKTMVSRDDHIMRAISQGGEHYV